jgi:2-methylisocitrate lyase-like PEP mutase family enzyme
MAQADKAKQFRALHAAPGAFVIANVWDGGSARMMAALGFAALATSSGASAGLLGRRDGKVTRDEALAQARYVTPQTSADLEKGFGDTPEIVAETIRLAAETGVVGCSIEDASGNPDAPIFELGLATERIAAAVEAVRSLTFPFTLTGRTENFLRGRTDLEDTIKRLQAYEAAGADALMAPGLPDLDAVRAVCAATAKPFNLIKGKSFTVATLNSGWGETDQPGDLALSRGDDRAAKCGQGGARARHLRVYRRLARHPRHERVPARLTEVCLQVSSHAAPHGVGRFYGQHSRSPSQRSGSTMTVPTLPPASTVLCAAAVP